MVLQQTGKDQGNSAWLRHLAVERSSLARDIHDALEGNVGYVLRSTLTNVECDNAVQQVWSFLEDTSSGKLHSEASLCKEASGYWSANGAGFLLGRVRELFADRLYEPLYGSTELHSSKEGFALLLHDKYETSIDESLSLCGAVDDDIPRIRSLAVLQGEVCISSSNISNPQILFLQTGDIFVWRSDTTLSIAVPSTTSILTFCTMQPAAWTDPEMLCLKMSAYKERRTGDYRPHLEKWQYAQRIQGLTGQKRQYFRTSPPLVTTRQAELYGLIPFDNASDTPPREKTMERAIIRGVRFCDEEETSVRPMSYPCSARLEFLSASDEPTAVTMEGGDKWLGGMASPCGRYVYGVPGHAPSVLRITLADGSLDCIGPSYAGKFKWLRGVEIPPEPLYAETYQSGCCIALPCNHPSILKINPSTSEVYTFGENVLSSCGATSWLYHGGNLASNGFVYAIPANAERVLKFHPFSDHTELIGPRFPGKAKWYGGIVGSDGCIWGIPHNHSLVLRIDPRTDRVSLLGLGSNSEDCCPLPDGMWKWHGGLRAGHKIIGFPNNSDSVLVIDCSKTRVYTIGAGILKSGRHRIPQDHRYKYLGGALTLDKRAVYLFPCDAEQVLRIDCVEDTLSLVGPLLLEGENKFQNGFVGHDGVLYGIPQRSCGVLRIVPRTRADGEDIVDIMDCGEELIGVKDKFEGGVLGMDQNIYCIPLRAKVCVKIVPCLR